MLAIRKHMRLARSGRINPETLAKANSWQLRRVAADFLTSTLQKSEPTLVESGKGAPTNQMPPSIKNMSAVLCFDEMQASLSVFNRLLLIDELIVPAHAYIVPRSQMYSVPWL